MGDWSKEPWGNDEAADWFGRYWNGGGIDLVIRDITDFSPESELYDSIRAACLVLECFGSAYAWPVERLEEREDVLRRAIEILENMLSVPSAEWGFLDMWANDPGVIDSVRKQIDKLEGYMRV